MPAPARQLFTSRVEQDVLVVTITEANLQGEPVAHALRRELLAAVAEGRVLKVVLDFQRVQSLSSAALRPLLSLRRKLEEAGGKFVLCNLRPAVAQTFETTRLNQPRSPGIEQQLRRAARRARRSGSPE